MKSSLYEDSEEHVILVGDVVCPTTPAGLELADVALNGEYSQKRKVTCIFKGHGVVQDISSCQIDYDLWDSLSDLDYSGIGVVTFKSYLIRCSDGLGWAGEGAIMPLQKLSMADSEEQVFLAGHKESARYYRQVGYAESMNLTLCPGNTGFVVGMPSGVKIGLANLDQVHGFLVGYDWAKNQGTKL